MGRTSKPEGENAAAPKPDQGDGKQADDNTQVAAETGETAGKGATNGEKVDRANSELSASDVAAIVATAGVKLAAGDILSFRARADSLTVVTTQGRKIRIVADDDGKPKIAD